MRIFLIVILFLTVPITLILLIPMGAIVSYKDNVLSIFLKIGFVTVKMNNNNSKNEKKEKKAEKTEKEQKKEEKKQQKKEKTKLVTSFDDVSTLLRIARKVLYKLRRSLRFNKIGVYYVAAYNDAAKTAVAYGGANAAAGLIMPVLREAFVIKRESIEIYFDFQSDKPRAAFIIDMTVVPVRALIVAIYALIQYLKYKKRKGGALNVKRKPTD